MNQVVPFGEKKPEPPHSIEAEQQLIGALLLNNDLASQARAIIEDGDFYELTHERIYNAIIAKIERGELASPVTMKVALAGDEGLRVLGGPSYLARMAGSAVAASAIRDYAKLIRDAAARREALLFLSEAQVALNAGAEATGDVLARLEGALVTMQPADSRMRPTSFLRAATAAIEQIDDAYSGKPTPSVQPPWAALWNIVPAFRAGDMVVVAGRPSMGKTAVALSLATAAARDGHPVIIASFEMSPEDMAMRALAEGTSEAGNAVSYRHMADGSLSEQQFRTTVDVAREMTELPIQFLTEDFRRPGALIAGVRQALRQIGDIDKTPLIIVDYMQLMEAKGRDLREQATEISKQMKHLAQSQGAVNIALSQLSRKVEDRVDKRPMLSDLRESGQIEQDADTVIFCYRDEYYVERAQPNGGNVDEYVAWEERMEASQGRLELIVGKQRRGPIGTAHLRCALAYNRIWEDGQ